MANYEHHRFYEGEKELPKLTQMDISVEDNMDFDEPVDNLILYLMNLEPLYIEHININNNRPDVRVVNELFFVCYKMFQSELDICVIYSEIIDFFGFNNKLFYKLLNPEFKKKLKIALSKRIDMNVIEKERSIEIKENGGIIPTFSQFIKLLST